MSVWQRYKIIGFWMQVKPLALPDLAAQFQKPKPQSHELQRMRAIAHPQSCATRPKRRRFAIQSTGCALQGDRYEQKAVELYTNDSHYYEEYEVYPFSLTPPEEEAPDSGSHAAKGSNQAETEAVFAQFFEDLTAISQGQTTEPSR
ncbi:MAG: hypothetical protein MUF49_05300 [Oculatellaceae cyanobacterium Prado106]|jgi:hypothetical protein|nr:hypothetical protein [Oculatellaceae cyanobacterium Prado106]